MAVSKSTWSFIVQIMNVLNQASISYHYCRGPGFYARTKWRRKMEDGRNGSNEATLEIGQLLEVTSSHQLGLQSINNRIVINISGYRFETNAATLMRFPETLLGNPQKCLPYFDPVRMEYYFDRCKAGFESIFYFYQSGGKLLKPQDISVSEFREELIFFQMGEDILTKFTATYCPHLGTTANIQKKAPLLPKNRIQRGLWVLFDMPESGYGARFVASISVVMILASIVTLCVESVQHSYVIGHRNTTFHDHENETFHTHTPQPYSKFAASNEIYGTTNQTHLSLKIGEAITTSWFAIEILIRLLTCPEKKVFCCSFLNICDMLAVLPFFVKLFLNFTGLSLDILVTKPFAMLRITRLVRVFPIFKLTRHSKNLQILARTFKASLNELGLLIFFFSISVVLFSSGVYMAEEGVTKEKFTSIPDSFWWAIITMSTVGYGDMVPKTLAGKMVGTLCALVGILTLSLPVPIIVSNFTYYYQADTSTEDGAPSITETLNRYSMMSPTVIKKAKN